MMVTIYFYRYPKGKEDKWQFFHNEFNMGKLPDFIAEIYKHNDGAIINEINIKKL